jgi:hypothetical protein
LIICTYIDDSPPFQRIECGLPHLEEFSIMRIGFDGGNKFADVHPREGR